MFQTHLQSGPLSSIKQSEPKSISRKEFVNKESIPVQNKTRKTPRNCTELPRGTNNNPSNSDIMNEIHKTQASLQGGLNVAKGLSAHLKVMAGRNSKKVRFHKSGLESGKPSKMKVTKRQHVSPAQISNSIYLTSPTHSIQASEGVPQILANDQVVDVTNDADVPNLSLTSEHSYVGASIPSDVCVCTNQLPKSQSQNVHLQAGVESQVKRRQSKLVSADSETSRNNDTEVLKSSSQNDNISSYHTNVCNCGTSKVPTSPCNSSVIHVKDSFPLEENTGDRDPQLATKLVVQSLPSVTIKRNLSVQKAPSVWIPPPDAPPYVSPRQNVGLCKMSHGGILLDICDCTSKSCDHKKITDKNVSKAEPKLLEETRKHAHQKPRRYKGSHASSELDKRDRVAAKERTHEGLRPQTISAVGSKRGKCNECEGSFLTNELKGELCNTCYNKSHNVLKLPAENESHKTKPHRRLSGSPLKQPSAEQYQFLCKRCGNNFPLRDLYYGVCGKCCDIPSSVRDASQLMHSSASEAVKAAAHLTQCSSCFNCFPQSELFYGHCIHCQIVKKEMRLLQCDVCLNSVMSTEYNNGTCNQCRDKIKSNTQKDELYAYPIHQGSAKERMLNTLLDGTPIFFDISKTEHLNKSTPTGENTSVENKKGNFPLSEADEKRQNCSVEQTTAERTHFVAYGTTRKNRGRNSKVHFETEERLNYNGSKSVKGPPELSRGNEERAVKLQEAQSEKLDSGDYHKRYAMKRTSDKRQTTLYFGTKDREYLSFRAQSCDKEDTCSNSNGCSHMEDQAAYNSVNNDDGVDATDDNSGYEHDIESGNRSTDTDVEISEDNGVYSRMYASASQTVKGDSKLNDTHIRIREVAAIQREAENLLKENPKWFHAVNRSGSRIMIPVLHHQLSTSNRGETDGAELSQHISKILASGDETDQSSNRIYSDDTSESISDTRVEIGSRIFKNAPAKSRQHNKYLFGDHSEGIQAADKKYSISKSKQSVTDIKKAASSHSNWQHGTESHLDTAADDTTRSSTCEYLKHCLDGNRNRRKPLETQEVACTNKQKQSSRTATVSEKSFGCRMNSEDENGEEKHCEVTVTR
jgi:hypothetical protein